MSEKSLFEAFKKGFNEGMLTIWAVFDLKEEEIKEKLSIDMLNNRILELYHLWMGF